MHYRKRPMDDFKPISKEKIEQSKKKIMIPQAYILRPNYAPTFDDIQTMVSKLYMWSEKDDSLRLNDFTHEMEVSYQVFCEWRKNWPILEEACQEVKALIAS